MKEKISVNIIEKKLRPFVNSSAVKGKGSPSESSPRGEVRDFTQVVTGHIDYMVQTVP